MAGKHIEKKYVTELFMEKCIGIVPGTTRPLKILGSFR